MQLTSWPPELVAQLVARGYRVIRFDNRDIGLSAKWDHAGVPNVTAAALRYLMGLKVTAPYTMNDMASDAIGVLDSLSIQKAHIVGASMGGMIGQVLAGAHSHRVASFTCIMSTSGARGLPGPTWRARQALLSRPRNPRDVDSIVDHNVNLFRTIGSPLYPAAAEELRARVHRSVTRSYYPQGTARQLVAVAASPDRTPLLREIKVPTHIIHGAVDPLVPVAAGVQLAATIRGATLDVIPGMGHDLPRELLPRFVEGIGRIATAR